MDVKTFGRIADRGGCAPSWRGAPRDSDLRIGFDHVHSLVVDDHSRLAYSEVLPDENARPAQRF